MKVRLSVFLAAMVVAISLAAPASAQAPAKVSIQLNWLPEPEFGGIYEAQRAGIFARHGLDVQILKGGPDVPAVQMTASGRVDFGIAAADEVIALREKGGDVVGLFATYQTSPQGIMVHASRGAKDIPDLVKSGGTLAVQPGLAYVKYFKQKYDMSKVKLVPYQGGVAQFINDKNLAQQCFVTAEPLVARKQGAQVKVFLIADTDFNPYTALVITRGEFLRSHRDVARKFVEALSEGWQAYLKAPGPANQMMAKLNPSMDLQSFADAAEAQKPLIQTEETSKLGLGVMTQARWETLAKQLVQLGIVAKAPPAAECYVNLK